MKKFGQKFEKLENKGKYLHGLFHNMAMNGKMKPKDQKDIKKKMNEIKEKFEEIEEMGDEKMEEIKQKKPTTVVPSFTEITRKQHVTEISEKLFSFENEVKGNFMEKNLTSAQEEEMMMVLGKKGAMLEKKAKRLHEIFEDMEKSGKENKEDVKVMKGKFEEFKNMMEEVVGMGKARWSKVQAHREESDNKEKKPEGKGKDTRERKPEGKGKDTRERKQ